VKAIIVIVTAMSEKRSPGYSGKNRGVTPSVAAPGVALPSDATKCAPPRTLVLTSTRVYPFLTPLLPPFSALKA